MIFLIWLIGSLLGLAFIGESQIFHQLTAGMLAHARVGCARAVIFEVTWTLLFLIAVC
jgi:hypothetical protein